MSDPMTEGRPHTIVVVANETAASRSLADLLEEKAKDRDVYVVVVAPVTQPRHGYVVYYDTRRASARRRLDKTLALLRERGIPSEGVVVETDPVSALRDAVEQLEPDEVIVSTHPEQKSGWLRRNAVPQMRRVAAHLPFHHAVVDVSAESGDKNVLVLANQTVLGEPLLERIRARAQEGNVSFLIISPQGDAEGSYDDAEKRLLRAIGRLRGEGLDVHGHIAHPDPYTAAMHALHDERVDEIIVSTLPNERSGWLRRDLVSRLRNDAKVPVDHVVVDIPSEVTA